VKEETMHNATRQLLASIGLIALMLFAAPAAAVPVIDRPVNDYAHVLSDADVTRISERIVATRNATGVQVALLVVDTTDGVPIDDYALATARQWRGGSADRNDGVLVTFAIRDRKSDIETGPGVQERLTDALCRRILDGARPALRSGRYGDAFTGVVTDVGEAVGARFGGVTSPVRQHGVGASDGDAVLWVVIIVLIALVLLAWWLSRRNRRGYRSSYGSNYVYFDGGSPSGGPSGGSGGGSIDWGGGGGGFDGGGGSSDW
jgi:uncharacterized protein